ncbi:hypothetical protein GCM10010124_24740 [Pilimelia terevasa]|uniref:Uncharacterized protein n=1 Tax=Pilimelia terevasa TaxID=53372 RepID=A0A8J3BSJ7_9ACTN|nr:ABC transporter substrate-binding protein [Pilimelia terevasa]GGK30957.1 hypothetical protein GCM10010124_24740 [Pilimelia terevasa]
MLSRPRPHEYHLRAGSRGAWDLDPGLDDSLVFAGVANLVDQIDRLTLRPYLFWRSRMMPILVLRHPPERHSPLPGLRRRFAAAGNAVPYAHPAGPAPRAPADTGLPGLIELLDSLVTRWRTTSKGRMAFSHYEYGRKLVTSSADVSVGAADAVAENPLFQQFVTHALPRGLTVDNLAPVRDQFPWWLNLVISGVSPSLNSWAFRHWRVARWFSHHQFSDAPERLAAGPPDAEPRHLLGRPTAEGSLAQLLVDALLHDIRRAYRPRPVRGRPSRYPVALLDLGVPQQRRLVELIEASRRSVTPPPGRHGRLEWHPDPLLVLAAERVPGDRPAAGWHAPDNIENLFVSWLNGWATPGLTNSWRLVVDLPGAGVGDGRELRRKGLPYRRRRLTTALLALALAAGGASWAKANVDGCAENWLAPSLGTTLSKVDSNECVGLSDDLSRFKPARSASAADAAMRPWKEVVALIQRHNDHALTYKPESYVTIAYFGSLTADSAQQESTRQTLEELRGLALAQQRARDRARPMRIVLANVGQNSAIAPAIAELIVDVADRERIMAVVGLGLSSTPMLEARDILLRASIPTVATVTSASAFARARPNAYQIGPSNARFAQVLGSYLGATTAPAAGPPRTVRIVHSAARDDNYSADLAAKTAEALAAVRDDGRARFEVSQDSYLTRRDLTDAATKSCDRDFVIYTGRDSWNGETDLFKAFLDGLDAKCPVKVIAGDSISNYVLQHDGGGGASRIPRTFDFLTMSTSKTRAGSALEFEAAYLDAFPDRDRDPQRARFRLHDGLAMLAYDAGMLVTAAAEQVGGCQPWEECGDPGPRDSYASWQQWAGVRWFVARFASRSPRWRHQVRVRLAELGAEGFAEGATGRLLYRGSPEPVGKFTHLLAVHPLEGRHRLELVFSCGPRGDFAVRTDGEASRARLDAVLRAESRRRPEKVPAALPAAGDEPAVKVTEVITQPGVDTAEPCMRFAPAGAAGR